jgi:K+-transporting ATPase ATPase A chain
MKDMGLLQILLTIIILVVLSIPIGKYVCKIITLDKSFVDPVFDKIDGLIYKLTGVKKENEMNWKEYSVSILLTNGVLFVPAHPVRHRQRERRHRSAQDGRPQPGAGQCAGG